MDWWVDRSVERYQLDAGFVDKVMPDIIWLDCSQDALHRTDIDIKVGR